MTEAETRVHPHSVVMPVPDEQALAIRRVAVLARVVRKGRRVLDAAWDGRRQAPARIDVTEQDVSGTLAGLLAAKPDLSDRRHVVCPVHRDRAAGVHEHTGAWVRHGHPPYELILQTEEIHRGPIMSL